MKKAKVTVQRGKAMPNGGSIQVTIPTKMRKPARIKPRDMVIVFQYEGPTIETGLFTIRSGDLVVRKDEPVAV